MAILLYGSWDGIKTVIVSEEFSLSAVMSDLSISFQSDSYAGKAMIIGFECTGSNSDNKIAVDNIRISYQ